MKLEQKNIFNFRNKVLETYKKFSQSFANIKAPDIQNAVCLECNIKNRFWPDPLIQVNPFYSPGKSIKDLVDKDALLHEDCKKIFIDRSGKPLNLYLHQEQAIDLAAQNKSFVVTSGTGSGKSLCFFIPIVDAILKAKEEEREKGKVNVPRTRAIVLYPMNALANSQYEEIQKYLRNLHDGKVTVGRYTGQENEAQRQLLKENPPDILLTNYMMLELVLMRPSDRKIVDNCKNLDFLVLDELHTYRGRQGSDVAMLLRRLREQLGTEDLKFIGTSATMTSVGDRKEQNEAVARFASKLFGEPIKPTQIISESLDRVTTGSQYDLKENCSLLEEAVKEAASGIMSYKDFSVLSESPLASWFELNLSVSHDRRRLCPKSPSKLVEQLMKDSGCDEKTCQEAFNHFLALFSDDSPLKTDKGRNPFPLKLHQFFSGPGKVYVTLNAPGIRDVTLMGQKYSPKFPNAKVPLFEAHFCRECGQEYIPVWITRNNRDIASVGPRNIEEIPASAENHEFGYICPVTPDQKYHGEDDLPSEWIDHSTKKIKSSRKKHIPEQITLNQLGQVCSTGTSYWYIPGKFKFCTNCLQTFNTIGREQNRLASLSGEGRSSATTVITLEMLRLLYSSEKEDSSGEEKRKVLGFSDNRQDAALQAGHFNDFVHQLIVRSALLNVLKKNNGKKLSLAELKDGICDAFSFGEDGKNNREFLASSLPNEHFVLNRALKAVRFLISFLLLSDLRDRRLYNNPTLEHLKLLSISYEGLDSLASDNSSPSVLLNALTTEERGKLLKMFLDEIRQRDCISSIYLEEREQNNIRSNSHNLLNDRWSLDVLKGSRAFYLDSKTEKIKASIPLFRFGERSGITKRIAELNIWEKYETQFPNLRKQRNQTAFQILQDLKDILVAKGILVRKTFSGNIAFQLDQNAIFWSYRGDNKEASGGNTFFRNLYCQLADELGSNPKLLSSIEASEHTAQLTSEERKELEQRFRASGKDKKEWLQEHPGQEFRRVPILFCSPTMELGIDISALNYVYMRNVPPTPANYVQRAGRAGRSGQQAFCAVYCTALSPHDQWFFRHPEEMVQGIVKEPTIDLTNESLIRNHLYSTWLSVARPELATVVSKILDLSKEGYPVLEEISALLNSKGTTEKAIEEGNKLLLPMKELIENEPWFNEHYVENVMSHAYEEFDKALDGWRNLYDATRNQIRLAYERIMTPGCSQREIEIANKRHDSATQQLKVLQSTSSSNSEFYVYRYLASQGFLPGYNFPALPMIAWIPEDSVEGTEQTMLSRARFLGITEFGPRNLIYHKGKIYRIERLKLNIQKSSVTSEKNLPTQTVAVCPHCGYAHPCQTDTIYNSCENCGASLQQEDYIQGLFQVSMVETREVERISIEDENRRSQGFEMQTVYRFAKGIDGKAISTKLDFKQNGETLAKLTYAPAASVQRVNLGWRYRKNQKTKGFLINPLTGYWDKSGPDSVEQEETAADKEESKGFTQTIVPFVEDKRNILLVEPQVFKKEILESEEAMATIQSALKQAIERLYQIESSEIFVEPLPSTANRKMLLIYEASEGGAGVLRNIVEKPSSLQEIADQALRLMHYEKLEGQPWDADQLIDNKDSCIAGCYECLLTYHNQPEHAFINRKDPAALHFLAALANGGTTESTPTTEEENKVPAAGFEKFLEHLSLEQIVLPDAQPKQFKRLGLTFDGAYTTKRTCLTCSPLSEEDKEALEEIGWNLIEISEPENWDNLIKNNPDVFARKDKDGK